MKILVLSTAFSGLTQRVVRELIHQGHLLEQHYGMDAPLLRKQIASFQPKVILCPFLTQRIPDDVWRNNRCLIVHPGIEGDRGPSSLDWCISDGGAEWGVTLLQADAEMDAGDIWGTANFPMRLAGKTSIYKREVTTAAVKLIRQALRDIVDLNFAPRSLDYSNPRVKGRCRDTMRQPKRKIDWLADNTETVINKINAADSTPGVLDSIEGFDVHLFGAREALALNGPAGEIIAMQNGSVCRATINGAVWIRQLKCKNHPELPPIKLSAEQVCQKLLPKDQMATLSDLDEQEETRDIRITCHKETAYIYFDFYNGAANTQQCIDLTNQLVKLKANSKLKILVFMGGEDFWSNGIHLNCIEGSEDPALESWNNINAIDDLVREIIDTPNQVTIAALRNNAGAGGAIMALACDEVVIRDGVVLNPHYQSMGLYGSEYWTYLLPRRVGLARTQRIMEECQPILAVEAAGAGMVDRVFPEDWQLFHKQLKEYCEKTRKRLKLSDFLRAKAARRAQDEKTKPLEEYRQAELAHMKETFYNPSSEYHRARRRFVYKEKAPAIQQAAPRKAGVA